MTKKQILQQQQAKIIEELKEYLKNGYANFSDDTLYYCQIHTSMGNNYEIVMKEIAKIIATYEATEVLKQEERRSFSVHTFQIIRDKIRYIESRDKREFNMYCYNNYYQKAISKSYLKESFFQQYLTDLDCKEFYQNQTLSEAFIENNIDYLCKNLNFLMYQKLSESFIKKYSDKVDWYTIIYFQKLSYKFIIKHIDKIKDIDIRIFERDNYSHLTEQEKDNLQIVLTMREVA